MYFYDQTSSFDPIWAPLYSQRSLNITFNKFLILNGDIFKGYTMVVHTKRTELDIEENKISPFHLQSVIDCSKSIMIKCTMHQPCWINHILLNQTWHIFCYNLLESSCNSCIRVFFSKVFFSIVIQYSRSVRIAWCNAMGTNILKMASGLKSKFVCAENVACWHCLYSLLNFRSIICWLSFVSNFVCIVSVLRREEGRTENMAWARGISQGLRPDFIVYPN